MRAKLTWALAVLLLVAGLSAWGYYSAQGWIDRQVRDQTAAIALELNGVRQEATTAKLALERERAAVSVARKDVAKAKAEALRASQERDAALTSAAAAAAVREAVHANVAQIPDREVRRRLRGGLARLGFLPQPGPGR